MQRVTGYLVAIMVMATMTAVIHVTHADSSLVIVPLLYLLAVQIIAFSYGSRAAWASFIAFLASTWYFVEPKNQFTIRDPHEFVVVCVFLVTAITIGQLTALFHNRAEEARRREIAATALAESSWIVASELDTKTALASVLRHLTKLAAFKQAAILLRRQGTSDFDVLADCQAAGLLPDEARIAQEAISQVLAGEKPVELAGPNNRTLYLPVTQGGECQAILFVETSDAAELNEGDRQVVKSISNHIAVVLHRDLLVKEQASAQALVETDRLKTALLQMVSHDFRSPLGSIKVSVSSLIDDYDGSPLDREARLELLNTIESETDRLNKLVGNLLDLSRLESGTWRPLREQSSIADLIGTTLDAFSPAQNKRIKVKLDSRCSEIPVDPVQIVQVLKNVVENALKYSSDDSIVEVETGIMDGENSFVVRVLDRGQGLPAGEEDRVFMPFYRGRQYRETSTPGVGMGLAVARGLVEAHGATLTAANREGGGAVFEVVFPNVALKAS